MGIYHAWANCYLNGSTISTSQMLNSCRAALSNQILVAIRLKDEEPNLSDMHYAFLLAEAAFESSEFFSFDYASMST